MLLPFLYKALSEKPDVSYGPHSSNKNKYKKSLTELSRMFEDKPGLVSELNDQSSDQAFA